MTKLTYENRVKISRDLIAYRFQDEVSILTGQLAALALAVYEDQFTEIERQKMASLPDGWLKKLNYITLTAQTGLYVNLNFSGEIYDLQNQGNFEEISHVYLPMPFSAKAKHRDAKDKLVVTYQKINEAKLELMGKIRNAHFASFDTMEAVDTIEELIELWPEIEPYAIKYSL